MSTKTKKPKLKREAVGWTRRRANIDTRSVILRESTRLFSEKGIDTTSMRDIAGAVGIQAASLYNHFKSRNEILFTVLVDAMHSLVESCTGTLEESSDSPTEKLFHLVRQHILVLVTHHESVPMMDVQLLKASNMSRSLTDPQRRELKSLQDMISHLFRDVLEEGKQTGEMEFEDSTVAAFGVLGMIEHTAYWYRPDGPIEQSQLADMLANQALNSVKATR